MFARLAACRDFGRRRIGATPVFPSFPNRSALDSGFGGGREPRRNALSCRWRMNQASGKPECFWVVGHFDATAAEKPRRLSTVVIQEFVASRAA